MFVNGNQVPFPMKIGEAGEAFFVFETEEDVPDSLVTSPLLEATQPGQTNADAQRAGRFGAKESPEKQPEDAGADMQEPEFLDLNAPGPRSELSPHEPELHEGGNAEGQASLLTRTAQIGKAIVGSAVETEKSAKDKLDDYGLKEAVNEVRQEEETFLKERSFAARNATRHRANSFSSFGSNKGDEALPATESVDGPDVVYTDGKLAVMTRRVNLSLFLDMVFDMEGYHSHKRRASGGTITPRGSSSSQIPSPPSTPGPSRKAPYAYHFHSGLILHRRHSVAFFKRTSCFPANESYIRTAVRAPHWYDPSTTCFHTPNYSSHTVSIHLANTRNEG